MAILKMQLTIKFQKTHPKAQMPTQGKEGDAAFDLKCVEDFIIYPGETRMVSTGLTLADMPAYDESGNSLFLQIEGRSGIASKGIFPIGGIIDATYRGEIKILLHNGNPTFKWDQDGKPEMNVRGDLAFKSGDKIAQLIIRKIVTNDGANKVIFKEVHEVTESVRGSDGFGSTDLQKVK